MRGWMCIALTVEGLATSKTRALPSKLKGIHPGILFL